MSLIIVAASVGVLAVTAYAVLGGADFGGGIWDLAAAGPRKEAQRAAIATAMGPVWEANHVWLIFLIVLLFTAFPGGFGALSTALYMPFTFALVGIVLRGAAFAFRAHARDAAGAQARWGRTFGAASVITPFFLGTAVGAVASGRITVRDGQVTSGFWHPWLGPFPLVCGALALALCSYLAAVYLTVETTGALREDFRRRALAAGGAVAVIGTIALPLARIDAPTVWDELAGGRSTPLILGAIAVSLGSLGALLARRYQLARITSVAEVALILWGWTTAQYPYLIVPDVRLAAAAAPSATLAGFLLSAAVGMVLLLPALWLLFSVFKGKNPAVESGHAETTMS
jgi:cytochrome bd ubiquinol oxidase subunit II